MNTSDPSGRHLQTLRERIAEATERLDDDGVPTLRWCEEMILLGHWLTDTRATMNRHQWRRHLREIRMPKAVADWYMNTAKSGRTAGEIVELMAISKAGFTVDELIEYQRSSGNDYGDKEGDR